MNTNEVWKPAYWRVKGSGCWSRGEILEIDCDLVEVRESWSSWGRDIRSRDEVEIKWRAPEPLPHEGRPRG